MIWRVVAFAIAGSAGAVLGLWSNDRESPTEILSAKAVSEPKPGGELRVSWDVYRKRPCAYSVDRIISDSSGTRFVLPDLEFKTAPGPLGEDKYTSIVEIPAVAVQGKAIYRYQAAYLCNPLHGLWPIVPPPVIVSFNIK